MREESILLLTKDAMCIEYLPCYGNNYWKGKTPNIDELAEKGTVFTRYYTAAPSSMMSYLAMGTGKFPYETGIAEYHPLEKEYSGYTMYDRARELGYSCHVIWDSFWERCISYGRCYGDTLFHQYPWLRQGVGAHNLHEGRLVPNEVVVQDTLRKIDEVLSEIASLDEKVFLWFHLPHVMNGRVSYGSDIDVFDTVLGLCRKYFHDDYIYVSADHGNMNGHKGVLGYGHHVYEPAIRIPLIAPRKNGLKICDALLCNVDKAELLFGNTIPARDVVYSDSAYYAQPKRSVAIIKGNYKYIFNKINGFEELYDLRWDPNEQFNLIDDIFSDADRSAQYPASELYFYDAWDQLPTVREEMRALKAEMWRDKPTWWKVYRACRHSMGNAYRFGKKMIGHT